MDSSYRLESLEPRLLLSGNGLIDEAVALTASPSETATLLQEDQADQEITISDQKISSYDPEAQLSDLFAAADSNSNPQEYSPDEEMEDSAGVVQTSAFESQSSAFDAESSQSSPAPHLSEGSDITHELVETLNAAEPPPQQGGVFVFTAKSGKNDLILRLSPQDHSRVEIFDTVTGEVGFSQPLAEIDRLLIYGTDAADDTLTIDFTDPFWIPQGIEFHGGDGGFDTLVFNGCPSVTARYTAVGSDGGYIALTDGSFQTTLSFTGLEPVYWSGSDLVFNTQDYGTGEDAIFIDVDLSDPGDPAVPDDLPFANNRISGTSGGNVFESVTFYNVANVTIDTGSNDTLSSADDTITIDTDGLVASGLESFVVLTRDGKDVVLFAANTVSLPLPGGSLSIDTGNGEDRIVFSGDPGSASVTVDGGDGVDRLDCTACTNGVEIAFLANI
jgi:hypothetical protein